MSTSLFIKKWQIAAEDLGLEIVFPFIIKLASGGEIKADLLLKNFGGPKGIIVVTDYDKIAPFVNEPERECYGFSTLSEPSREGTYDRGTFIDMLSEWGWAGEDSKKPDWYIDDWEGEDEDEE